jgi:hypothetical protein
MMIVSLRQGGSREYIIGILLNSAYAAYNKLPTNTRVVEPHGGDADASPTTCWLLSIIINDCYSRICSEAGRSTNPSKLYNP